MMKKLVGLLAAAVILSAGAPALAKEASAKREVAAPAWTCTAERAPGNYQDTTPQPFGERCSVNSSGHSSIKNPIR
jgi:hypothetical protein